MAAGRVGRRVRRRSGRPGKRLASSGTRWPHRGRAVVATIVPSARRRVGELDVWLAVAVAQRSFVASPWPSRCSRPHARESRPPRPCFDCVLRASCARRTRRLEQLSRSAQTVPLPPSGSGTVPSPAWLAGATALAANASGVVGACAVSNLKRSSLSVHCRRERKRRCRSSVIARTPVGG